MTDATKQDDGQEPTMEEILASIRQIISDNEHEDGEFGEVAEAGGGVAAAVLEENEEDILELTEIVDDFAGGLDSESEPEPELEPDSAAAALSPITDIQTLLSDHTAEVATDKLSGLTGGAVAAARDLPLGYAQQTLEDLVKDLLRPMLKEWLDDNLPPLVERLVEKEIAKLVGRAEGH